MNYAIIHLRFGYRDAFVPCLASVHDAGFVPVGEGAISIRVARIDGAGEESRKQVPEADWPEGWTDTFITDVERDVRFIMPVVMHDWSNTTSRPCTVEDLITAFEIADSCDDECPYLFEGWVEFGNGRLDHAGIDHDGNVIFQTIQEAS